MTPSLQTEQDRSEENDDDGFLYPLPELGLTPQQTLRLEGNQRSRLLNFLLRWEHLDAIHACLDILIPANPALVSLLDLRARAFLAQARYDKALAVMRKRFELKTSVPARVLVARIHLADGDAKAAHSVASGLVEEQSNSPIAWRLLGDQALAQGKTDTALAAFHRLNELRPQGRAYLSAMLSFYEAHQDQVTASGYAVRLLRSADAERPLSVVDLRRLRDYFRASGEETRHHDLQTELEQRYAYELAELQAALSPTYQAHAPPTSPPLPAVEKKLPPVEFLPTFDQVPVSEEEQARITAAARRAFGFASLLPGQMETIACVLRGEDALTILPTGGGKSLCYQLPALLAEQGTTLVISPLIALMKDQVDSLPAGLRGRATTVNSTLPRDALRQRLQQIAQGGYRLVYAAPERLRQPTFLHALRQGGVSRLVIDEAHCVSAWGHDFRPDYLSIGRARQALGNPALLAMTATAPARVRRDILRHLSTGSSPERNFQVIAGDVTRPNLRLEVYHARNQDDKLQRLLAFCLNEPGSGIVYAGTRARCEELAALLRQHKIVADHYHAGIADRNRVQDDFMADQMRVVVATVAFGLGIDKPNIRFIVHFAPPDSLEAYYQEAGRAGRDGLPARCLLMYTSSDRASLTRRSRQSALSIDFLRAIYGAVKQRLGKASAGRIAAADLERDLQADRTRIRVGLSFLEEAELLRRGPDFPRSAIVRLVGVGQPGVLPDRLAAFCEAARLRPDQSLTLDLAEVAQQAGLPLDEVERQVLEWTDDGWLTYLPSGRDLLLEMGSPPTDAADRIQALLERYETIQVQRVDEITAYAKTDRCRHGHINAYLGGRSIDRCGTCDNCVDSPQLPEVGLIDEREQLLVILRCVSLAPWSWGRRTLMRILRGNTRVRPGVQPLHKKACESEAFGALMFRSQTAIRHMLNLLETHGFLRSRGLEHGGIVLDITAAGHAALDDPTALDGLVSTRTEPSPAPRKPLERAAKKDEPRRDVDDMLFEKLRAWRLEQARERKVPPYVVFHDSHLRNIAACRPATLAALSELRGIGPRKLDLYGEKVVILVREHLQETETGEG